MGELRSVSFKLEIVRRLMAGEQVRGIERETGIHRAQFYRWRDAYRRSGEAGLDTRPGRVPGVPRNAVVGAVPLPPAPVTTAPSVAGFADLSPEVQAWVSGLERMVARQRLELDFFSEALRQVEASRRTMTEAGGTVSTPRSE